MSDQEQFLSQNEAGSQSGFFLMQKDSLFN